MADPQGGMRQYAVKLPDGTTKVVQMPSNLDVSTVQAALAQYAKQYGMHMSVANLSQSPSANVPMLDRAGMGVKMTPEGQAGYLESRFGQGNVVTDESGSFYLKQPGGGFGAVDPKGMDWGNVAEFLAPLALEAAPTLAVGTNPLTVAGASTVGNFVRQGVSEMLPGSDNMTMQDRAREGAIAGALGGATQKVFNLAAPLIDKIRPHNLIAQFIRKLEASPQGSAARLLSRGSGVSFTPGQESGSRSVLAMEALARRHPASADKFLGFEMAQLTKITENLDRVLNALDNRALGHEQVGAIVAKTYDDAWNGAMTIRARQAGKDFGALSLASGGQKIVPVQNVLGAIDGLITQLDIPGGGDATAALVSKLKALRNGWTGTPAKTVTSPVLDPMGGAITQNIPAQPAMITADTAQRLLQLYTKAAAGKATILQDVDAAQQKWIARTVLDAMQGDLDAAANSGAGPVVDLLRIARDNYRKNSAFIKEMGDTVLGRMFGGKFDPSPERVAERIAQMAPSDIRVALGVLAKQDPSAVAAVQRNILERAAMAAQDNVLPLRDGSGNVIRFSARKFLSALPDQKVLDEILGGKPMVAMEVKGIVDSLERVANTGMAGESPTAPLLFAWDMAKGLFTLNPIGYAGMAAQVVAPRQIATAMTTPPGRQALRTLIENKGMTGPVSKKVAAAIAFITALRVRDESRAANVRPIDVSTAPQPTLGRVPPGVR